MSRYAALKVVPSPVPYPDDVQRPRTRAECVDGPRPCPFVSCRHHLMLDVAANGAIWVNQRDLDIEKMTETCSLDVAARGEHTLDQIAKLFGLTRERIRQVENRSLKRLVRRVPKEVR